MTDRGLSRWGRTGLALFFIHVILLFFPPIPPDIKGSLWSYLAGYLAVLALLVELGGKRAALAGWWTRRGAARRWAIGLGLALGTFALVLVVRWLAPPLYARFSREEGLWEPLTLLCYLSSAIVLAVSGAAGAERRHWRFVAGLYVLMGLEEIDYFGIFGGLIGRVEGIYAGSLHDLIQLGLAGVLSPTAWAVIGGLAIVLAVALWRLGYLQPSAILAMIWRRDFLWVELGLAFLVAAAAAETGLFEMAARPPTLEEGLELVGGVCFFCYALSAASRLGIASPPSSSPTG